MIVNYHYYLQAYYKYVKESILSLNGWRQVSDSQNIGKLVNHLAFQIDSYFKKNLLKYVIHHEFTLLEKNGYLIGKTDEDKEFNYIYDISNTEDWIYYIFEKYPLIDNLFYIFTKNTISYIDSILCDYVNDKEHIHGNLIKTNSAISDIELFLGDSHGKGKFVSKMTFEDGQALMYKPRSSQNERVFKNLIESLEMSGIDIYVRIPKSLEISGHSWCEYVSANDVTEEFDSGFYYDNMGKLLCVLYAIGASDIIPDNMMCIDGIPTLIDLECILKKNITNKKLSLFANYYDHSIINVGILPVWRYSSMNERNAMSSILFRSIENDHLPKRKDYFYEISLQTKRSLLKGFSECYSKLEELDLSYYDKCFENCNQRLIIHDTSLYSFLQRELLLPDYLHGSKDIKSLINKSIPAAFSEYSSSFIDSILDQLLNYDIPSFYVDSNNNIIDGYGRFIVSMENLTTFKRTLSNKDKIVQCRIIDSSIEQVLVENNKQKVTKLINYDNLRLGHDKRSDNEDNCLKAAIKIADELFAQKLEIETEVNWIAKGASRLDGRYQTDILDESLYSGTAGLALLYAQIGYKEDVLDYQQLSRKIFNNLIEQFYKINESVLRSMNYSVESTISYHNFPLCCLFLACHNTSLFSCNYDLANDIIKFAHNNCLHNINDCGYLGGLAGYLDFLIELKKNDFYNVSDTLILEAYEKLISREMVKGEISLWPQVEFSGGNTSSVALGGFSHGSSGIAYVLYKFSKLMNDDDAYARFIRTLNHDRTYFDKTTESWIDGRRNDNNQDMASWCHGAGGIGLSRALLVKEGYNDDIIQEEMRYAVSIIKKHLGDNQCVCHGDLGNLEILKILGEELNDVSISEYADSCIKTIALRVINDEELVYGDGSTFPTLGLFLGRSGIAYQLFRFAHWGRVPSILYLNFDTSESK